MLRVSTITTLVALMGLLGCASLPDKLYRQIGDSEIGKINRIGLMQKYGPPQRIDKIDGHEFWTYVLDLGVQSNSFGTSYLIWLCCRLLSRIWDSAGFWIYERVWILFKFLTTSPRRVYLRD